MTGYAVNFYLHSMRTITGFTALVIILCIVPVLSAQEKLSDAYAFSICPQFGVLYGQSEEIVFPGPENKAKLLSLLTWDINTVFYYGLLLDFSQKDTTEKWGLFSNFSLKYCIPGISGKMEDRDWQSEENNALTSYSIHDNLVKEFFFMDITAGFSYPLYHAVLLKAFVNMSFMRFCFYGMDGHGTYARGNPPKSGNYYPITDNPDELPFSGRVINYTQEWLIVAPGVSLGWFLTKKSVAELSFMISPLISCADLDEHLTTNTQYRDYMQGGLYYEPGFRFSYAFNKWIDITFEYSYRFIGGSKGVTYSSKYSDSTYAPHGTAGSGLSLTDASLLLKTRL